MLTELELSHYNISKYNIELKHEKFYATLDFFEYIFKEYNSKYDLFYITITLPDLKCNLSHKKQKDLLWPNLKKILQNNVRVKFYLIKYELASNDSNKLHCHALILVDKDKTKQFLKNIQLNKFPGRVDCVTSVDLTKCSYVHKKKIEGTDYYLFYSKPFNKNGKNFLLRILDSNNISSIIRYFKKGEIEKDFSFKSSHLPFRHDLYKKYRKGLHEYGISYEVLCIWAYENEIQDLNNKDNELYIKADGRDYTITKEKVILKIVSDTDEKVKKNYKLSEFDRKKFDCILHKRRYNPKDVLDFNVNEEDKVLRRLFYDLICYDVLIEGGPGTGKTTAVKKIIKKLDRNKILVLAPTASLKKNYEGLNVKFMTLHKFLKINEFDEKYLSFDIKSIDENELPKIIIVDEVYYASDCIFKILIDFLSLYSNRISRIIFLGDQNQIRNLSIDLGPIFSSKAHKLTKDFRGKNRQIKEISDTLKSIELLKLAKKNNAMIICDSKKLTNIFNKDEILPGEEVICNRNHIYRFNSEDTSYSPNGELYIFRGKDDLFCYLENQANGDIEMYSHYLFEKYFSTARAITVHKAQGNEFDSVIYIKNDDTAKGSNMYETAITRSKNVTYVLSASKVMF